MLTLVGFDNVSGNIASGGAIGEGRAGGWCAEGGGGGRDLVGASSFSTADIFPLETRCMN